MRPYLLTAMLLAGVVPVLAHHGWGSYDAQKPITLEGTLKRVEYSNPHVHVELTAGGSDWEATLAPPFRMNARGIAEAGIKTGMSVKLHGYPSRQNAREMRAEWIEIAGKRTELR